MVELETSTGQKALEIPPRRRCSAVNSPGMVDVFFEKYILLVSVKRVIIRWRCCGNIIGAVQYWLTQCTSQYNIM